MFVGGPDALDDGEGFSVRLELNEGLAPLQPRVRFIPCVEHVVGGLLCPREAWRRAVRPARTVISGVESMSSKD